MVTPDEGKRFETLMGLLRQDPTAFGLMEMTLKGAKQRVLVICMHKADGHGGVLMAPLAEMLPFDAAERYEMPNGAVKEIVTKELVTTFATPTDGTPEGHVH